MLRQAKNRLLELKTKPSMLVLYIIGIGALVFFVVTGMNAEMPLEVGNIAVFKGALAGFFMFMFFTSLMAAFMQGASLFEMQDVNALFVSPIRPGTILLYGLVKSIKAIVLGSWFMVFQINWMRGGFGISMGGVAIAALGYILMSIVIQVMSLFIYAFTNVSHRRKRVAKGILAAMFVPAAVIFLANLSGGAGYALFAMLDSPVFEFTPIVGWTAAGITHLLLGEAVMGLILLGLLLVTGIVLFMAVYLGNPDYYEDVMGATETAFAAVQAAQENVTSAMHGTSDKPVKLKGIGIDHGAGASVFYYRHVREAFRANRLGLWGLFSIILVAGTTAWAFFVRDSDGTGNILGMLITLCFMKMFTSGMGKGYLEPYTHYIYLVPDSPFMKWLWANMESMLKVAVESVLIFGIAGVIMGAPIGLMVACAVCYVIFTFYDIGVSLTILRFTGAQKGAVLLIVVQLAAAIVPLVPGVVAAVFVGILAPAAVAMTLAVLTAAAWMLLVGVGCFALSKGVLHDCDMPVAPVIS